jgi:EmrB/QacA subfamily drug resistance transporter
MGFNPTNRGDQLKLDKRDLLMVAIVISGGFITILNQTVMSPALPSIMHDFQISAAIGQWLTTIFLLVNGILVPITAFLINRFTTRQLFFASMLIFTAGSVLAALAQSFSLLMVGRILQAIGAGIQLPFGSVLMMQIFPKERRGTAMGIVGIVIAFAPAFGPTLAGWIVDQWGWRYIFAGIAPLAGIIIIFAAFFLRNVSEKENSHLDWLSVTLSTLAFGGLLYGFSTAGSSGWQSPQTIVPIIVGGAALYLFGRRQFRLPDPLLKLRVLDCPEFSCSVILSMVISAGVMVGTVITPIFLQTVLGHSAMYSGLVLMPGAILMGVMSPISGTLFDRFGPRNLCLTGLSLMIIGSVMLSLMSIRTSIIYIAVAYALRAFGMSMVNMPINTWGINALANADIAHGNAINNTARQVAGSIGTATLVTVMVMVTALHPEGGAEASAWGINAAFAGSGLLTLLALLLAFLQVDRRPQKVKS